MEKVPFVGFFQQDINTDNDGVPGYLVEVSSGMISSSVCVFFSFFDIAHTATTPAPTSVPVNIFAAALIISFSFSFQVIGGEFKSQPDGAANSGFQA